MKVRQGVFGLNLDSLLEVLDCVLVIAHVLVDETTLDVDCLVVLQQFTNLSELLQGFVEMLGSAVHESQMEHRRDECWTVFQ